jgi:predicted dehydrogenase
MRIRAIVCENPLARTMAEARRIIALTQEVAIAATG